MWTIAHAPDRILTGVRFRIYRIGRLISIVGGRLPHPEDVKMRSIVEPEAVNIFDMFGEYDGLEEAHRLGLPGLTRHPDQT